MRKFDPSFEVPSDQTSPAPDGEQAADHTAGANAAGGSDGVAQGAGFNDELRARLARGGKLLPLGEGCYYVFRGSKKSALKRLAEARAASRRGNDGRDCGRGATQQPPV
jgi:hypothetical protein